MVFGRNWLAGIAKTCSDGFSACVGSGSLRKFWADWVAVKELSLNYRIMGKK